MQTEQLCLGTCKAYQSSVRQTISTIYCSVAATVVHEAVQQEYTEEERGAGDGPLRPGWRGRGLRR